MPQFELEGRGTTMGGMGTAVASRPAATPVPGSMLPAQADERSRLDAFKTELTEYYVAVRSYSSLEPDEVLLSISGIGGRLIEMRSDCIRDGGARMTALRTKEIDPLLDHLDFQFKIHSRVVSIREFDLKLAGPQT